MVWIRSFVNIAGRPLLAHTVDVFQKCAAVDRIVMVLSESEPGAGAEDGGGAGIFQGGGGMPRRGAAAGFGLRRASRG